jgi:hypothetical protein
MMTSRFTADNDPKGLARRLPRLHDVSRGQPFLGKTP